MERSGMADWNGQTTPVELQARLGAERRGGPFLVYRDGAGAQQIVELDPRRGGVTIGRSPAADISLGWDADASRVHAELQLLVEVWTVVDDGLSRNGTFVNGERIHGRRRLNDGDRLQCGRTVISYRAPADANRKVTADAHWVEGPRLSEAQRRVLVALARPFHEASPGAAASNPQIAAELQLSVQTVKSHIRALFDKFGVEDLPQNQKRARLAALALQTGQLSERELDPPRLDRPDEPRRT